MSRASRRECRMSAKRANNATKVTDAFAHKQRGSSESKEERIDRMRGLYKQSMTTGEK